MFQILLHRLQINAINEAAKFRRVQWSSVGLAHKRRPTKHVKIDGINWCN